MTAKKVKPSYNLENISITMNMQADGATQLLAEALLAQANANKASSEAMQQLAKALKPTDVYAIKITSDGIDLNQ